MEEKQKNILENIFRFTISWHFIPISISALGLLFFLLGFLGRFNWFFELFVNFRPQYLIVALVSAISLSFKKKNLKFAIFAYAVSLIILLFILPIYISRAKSENQKDYTNIRVMQINVFSDNGKFEKVKNAILENDPDIVLLEEVNTKWVENFKSIRKRYPVSIQQPREDNFGIAMFAKIKPEICEIRQISISRVPYVYAEFHNTVFFGIHTLPPIGSEYFKIRNEMLREIAEKIKDQKAKGKKVILLGDLNLTPWSYFFRKLENDTGLINSQQGFGIQPSWPDKLFFLRVPIDHCLISHEINVKNRKIGKWVGSDHFPLVVDLEIPE